MARIIKQAKCDYARFEAPRPETGKAAPPAAAADAASRSIPADQDSTEEGKFSSLEGLFPSRPKKGQSIDQADSANSPSNGPNVQSGSADDSCHHEIERLRQEAEKVKEAAIKEAEGIVEEAKKRAEEIESQAYSAGYEQGQKDGLEIGRQQFQIKIQHLESALKKLQEESAALYGKYEAQLLAVALCVARQVVGAELTTNSSVISNALKAALENVVEGSTITVHLHPRDYEAVKEALDSELSMPGANRIAIEANQGVSRGGCFIETDFGLIDATSESRWTAVIQQIEALLRQRTGHEIPGAIKGDLGLEDGTAEGDGQADFAVDEEIETASEEAAHGSEDGSSSLDDGVSDQAAQAPGMGD